MVHDISPLSVVPHGIDINAVRADTPGCQSVAHLNNAGSSLSPAPVVESLIRHVEHEARVGGYEAAEEAGDAIQSTYSALASLLGTRPHQIALIENATRAWDMAFYGLAFRAGDRILTCRSEYASNYLAYLQVARLKAVVVEPIPDNEHGEVDVVAAARMMDSRVRLISITHVPTSSGLVNPAIEIGRLARDAGCYYLLDACQSVGQMPIDVEEIGCDFLSTTGRKFLRGPRGTGLLYASERAIAEVEPPMIDGHAARWTGRDQYVLRDDARRFENWEFNAAARIALGVAARYATAIGLPAIWARVSALADRLRSSLSSIPRVRVCDRGRVRCAIVSFVCQGHSAEAVTAHLRRHQVHCWTVDAQWTWIDMDARGLVAVVRASPHYYNTEAEVDALAAAVEALLASPTST